jgi:hypothetical protein
MNNQELGMRVLDVPLEPNDSGADTIRGYLAALLRELWEQGECFSGKRPLGNSGWECDLLIGLAKAGLITATFDSEGCLEDLKRDEQTKGEKLVGLAIAALGEKQ